MIWRLRKGGIEERKGELAVKVRDEGVEGEGVAVKGRDEGVAVIARMRYGVRGKEG